MKHAKLILFFALVLVLSITSTNTSDSVVTDNIESEGINSSTIEFKLSYEEHSKITIVGDTAFETQAGIEEWEGEGTELHPYLIKGYNFSDPAGGISISDVSLYFDIRDCLITYPTFQNRVQGMYLHNATHVNVVNCTINNFSHGLSVYSSSGSTIENCTVFDASYYGIYFNAVNDSAVVNCTVYGIMTEGIAFHSSRHCNITNNQVYDTGTDAIYVQAESDFCVINGNILYDNAGAGIYLWNANNCTVQNNIAHDNSYEGEHCGIDLTSSANCTIIDNEFYNNVFAGVNLYNSPNCDIVSNSIYNNSDYGIYGVLSDSTTITDNDIYENGWWGAEEQTCGISFGETERWYIEGNNIWNNSANGIWCQANYTTIKDNVIFDNAEHGIVGSSAMNCNVISNTIYDNADDGVRLGNSNDWNITHNIIYDNSAYGISLISALNCWVYYNDLGWNAVNAYDEANSGDNYWHDNVNVGNWWHDWESGNYTVAGTYHINDTHAAKNMFVENATEMEYESGTTGHNMIWTAFALNPDSYEFYVDEELFDSGTWDGSDIDVDVTGLDTGFHDVVLIVYHVSGHSLNGTSNVTLTSDIHSPTWDVSPSTPITIEFGEQFSYDVDASDPSGLDKWWLNDTSFEIDSNGIITNATVLAVGDYGLIISVNDTLGNILTAIISVQVRDSIIPEWDTLPQDQTIEFGNIFIYQMSASDLSGIVSWSVNDTSNFAIDSNGLLTNSTTLQPGSYVVTISVEDIHGNTLSIEITITVNDAPTTTPTTTPTDTTAPIDPVLFLVMGLGGAGLIVVIVIIGVSKKKGS